MSFVKLNSQLKNSDKLMLSQLSVKTLVGAFKTYMQPHAIHKLLHSSHFAHLQKKEIEKKKRPPMSDSKTSANFAVFAGLPASHIVESEVLSSFMQFLFFNSFLLFYRCN